MSRPSADEAGRLLGVADTASGRGRDAVRRPGWYPYALGGCTGLALAGFAVPGMATTGIVVGAIILPVWVEYEARRRTGGSPHRAYLDPPFRRTTIAAVLLCALVAGASLVALKVTEAAWVVLPGAAIVAGVTTVVARRVERLRGRHVGSA